MRPFSFQVYMSLWVRVNLVLTNPSSFGAWCTNWGIFQTPNRQIPPHKQWYMGAIPELVTLPVSNEQYQSYSPGSLMCLPNLSSSPLGRCLTTHQPATYQPVTSLNTQALKATVYLGSSCKEYHSTSLYVWFSSARSTSMNSSDSNRCVGYGIGGNKRYIYV